MNRERLCILTGIFKKVFRSSGFDFPIVICCCYFFFFKIRFISVNVVCFCQGVAFFMGSGLFERCACVQYRWNMLSSCCIYPQHVLLAHLLQGTSITPGPFLQGGFATRVEAQGYCSGGACQLKAQISPLFTSPFTSLLRIEENLDPHRMVVPFLVFILGIFIFPRNKMNALCTANSFLSEMKASSFATGPKIVSPLVLIKQCLHLKSGLFI